MRSVNRHAGPAEGNVQTQLNYPSRHALVHQMAPQYREVSRGQKTMVLNAFVAITGYSRKYAMQLLNHPQELKPSIQRPRPPHYGPEVQQALFLAWKAANRICAKRLIPFLPMLVGALERHGHLHLTEECRDQLLSMSAATADRFLSFRRKAGPRGISTTRAGTLLKNQIPIRTFQDWNETQPGFLEADLVAHCGIQAEGGYLYTLTLTDIATGWTECLPLLYRSRETVLAAFQRAQTLFPFPILGLDTDNGGEFLNEDLVAYCAQEHLTFTRGRPYQKRDQCFVEQKNGAIVRKAGRL
jgi:Integrase core domain